MKLSYIAVGILAAFFEAAQACKCVDKDTRVNNLAATKDCCETFGGTFSEGVDCTASTISERLTNFSACCGRTGDASDCPCMQCGKPLPPQ